MGTGRGVPGRQTKQIDSTQWQEKELEEVRRRQGAGTQLGAGGGREQAGRSIAASLPPGPALMDS